MRTEGHHVKWELKALSQAERKKRPFLRMRVILLALYDGAAVEIAKDLGHWASRSGFVRSTQRGRRERHLRSASAGAVAFSEGRRMNESVTSGWANHLSRSRASAPCGATTFMRQFSDPAACTARCRAFKIF